MAKLIEVNVPDIGDFKDVPVIEVMVKPGQSVSAEESLITLESEKATIDVPSPAAGTVKDVKLKVGDKVSQGSLVLTLEAADTAPTKAAAPAAPQAVPATPTKPAAPAPAPDPAAVSTFKGKVDIECE